MLRVARALEIRTFGNGSSDRRSRFPTTRKSCHTPEPSGSRIVSACAIKPMSCSNDVKSRSLEKLHALKKVFRIGRVTIVRIGTLLPEKLIVKFAGECLLLCANRVCRKLFFFGFVVFQCGSVRINTRSTLETVRDVQVQTVSNIMPLTPAPNISNAWIAAALDRLADAPLRLPCHGAVRG